ncbi:ribosomal protein S19 binding protein 1 [Pristis pectinata]|uniref:ribosomal protein S19 binding protein 1 n=1 Tax=Pristis pectinata TaxID=685728 RepID=UPI00223D964A|nr:ribosomal protein S19 binding protein 1 [Pristis pectinata]
MSAALVRKGLDLMSEDVTVQGQSRKTNRGHAADADRLVNTSKKERRKQLERIRRQQGRNKATVKGKIVKSALEEYRKNRAADHTEENLQYMLGSKFLTESSVTEKVLTYNQGRKAKDRPKEKKVKKEETSIFSESDFKKFQREYFGTF